jgi:diguanylate cyclase (GGDEF)-like protein
LGLEQKTDKSNPVVLYILMPVILLSVLGVLFFFQPDPVIVISVVGGLVLAMAVFLFYERQFSKIQVDIRRLNVELADKNRQLSHVSDVDHLTDLPHRETIKVFLDQYVEVAKRKKTALGLLHIDLDHFHDINEEQGTVVGDQVLKAISKRLKSCLRKSDIIGRFGADEFLAILLDPIDPNTAALVARKVQSAIHKPMDVIRGKALSASIGIALFPKDGENVEALINSSSHATEIAKAHGRAQFQLFDSSVQQEWEERLLYTKILHNAISEEEFTLHFQPKIDHNKAIIGAEALIRWYRGKEKELILPNNFIPLAEETGLIIPIGYWVIEEACRQYKIWQEEGLPRFKIGVNVSPLQLKDPHFLEKIVDILERTDMNPKDLEFEITESALVDDMEHMIKLLAEFHTLGLSISIDDFGTGYSNLSKLTSLPLDVLKVDKSFIDVLVKDPRSRSITRLIIQMAQSLGLKVIAEGVETEDQFSLLQEWGCSHIQGYLFSPPLPATEFRTLLSTALQTA